MTLLKRLGALAAACLLLAVPAAAIAQTAVLATPSTSVPLMGCAFGAFGAAATSCSSANPLPVTVATPSAATSTDASGTVTTGGSYQTLFASNASRKGCLIQNPANATEVLRVKVGTMASPFELTAGATFSCRSDGGLVVTDAITVSAATTSHAFIAVSQ